MNASTRSSVTGSSRRVSSSSLYSGRLDLDGELEREGLLGVELQILQILHARLGRRGGPLRLPVALLVALLVSLLLALGGDGLLVGLLVGRRRRLGPEEGLGDRLETAPLQRLLEAPHQEAGLHVSAQRLAEPVEKQLPRDVPLAEAGDIGAARELLQLLLVVATDLLAGDLDLDPPLPGADLLDLDRRFELGLFLGFLGRSRGASAVAVIVVMATLVVIVFVIVILSHAPLPPCVLFPCRDVRTTAWSRPPGGSSSPDVRRRRRQLQ